ncbi:MAG: hypothetical protein RLZZ61_1384 [Pseudomonadota bacterium]|jgi:hypothetical protein
MQMCERVNKHKIMGKRPFAHLTLYACVRKGSLHRFGVSALMNVRRHPLPPGSEKWGKEHDC